MRVHWNDRWRGYLLKALIWGNRFVKQLFFVISMPWGFYLLVIPFE
jgi:hypothetical protein